MAHSLPPLPYDAAALEPHIAAQTMQIHHGKHHAAYVNNLNAALEKHPDLAGKSAEDLIKNLAAVPEDIRTAVRNNGGGALDDARRRARAVQRTEDRTDAKAGAQPLVSPSRTADGVLAIDRSERAGGLRAERGRESLWGGAGELNRELCHKSF